MNRSMRRIALVLVTALALLGLFVSAAYASLEDTPTPLGTSTTNPNSGAEGWWRADPVTGVGWGNSMHPKFTLNLPSLSGTVDEYMLGMLYQVDRDPLAVIDSAQPGLYDNAVFGAAAGSATDQTLDLNGIYLNPPVGGWPVQASNEHTPLEGVWFYHFKFYTNKEYQIGQWTGAFGIDQTAPRAVTGLKVATAPGGAALSTWTAATRACVSWDASQTDDLAGDAYFQVLLDDEPYIPADETGTNGRLYATALSPTPNALTIENMPAGKHKISVRPVDRATNVGPDSSIYFYSDPDTPTVSITSPTALAVGANPLLSAGAADKGGVASVVFKLDGVQVLSETAAPYSGKADLSAFADGWHTLTCTVTDRLGRQVTDSRTVSLDKTPPAITGLATSGYHRTATVKFTVDGPCAVRVYLRYANVTKTVTASKAGTYSISYTYPKKSSRYPSPVSFYDSVSVTASDSFGNSTSASTRVKCTLAKIVRVSRSRVRIVYY